MTLRLGLSGDFLRDDGTPVFADMGIGDVDLNGAEWNYILPISNPVRPDELDRYDGLVLLAPRVTAESLAGIERLRIIARFGVGYESVDVAACTRAGVVLTITPDGVRRPVAAAAMALLLALAHQLIVKDRLTRDGRWSERTAHHGYGLVGRTLGIIGLGNIGREVARLAAPFDMRIVASDPLLVAGAAPAGVEVLDLGRLLEQADFVCVCCPLTSETHHLMNSDRLARMKPSAFLINVARGPIVDQTALVEALKSGRIRGAGLDVFETEPIPADDPLLALENVIVSPHSLSWTDQMFRETGRSAVQSVVDLFGRKAPRHIVNPEVRDHPRVRDWLAGSP